MNKPFLALLLTAALLVLAVIPTNALLSKPTGQTSSVNSSPKFVPSMSVSASVDKDHNRVSDSLDQEIASKNGLADDLAQPVNVTVMLKTAPTTSELLSFASSDGVLTTSPWTYAIFGFGGHIPYGKVLNFAKNCPICYWLRKKRFAMQVWRTVQHR